MMGRPSFLASGLALKVCVWLCACVCVSVLALHIVSFLSVCVCVCSGEEDEATEEGGADGSGGEGKF